MKRISLVSVTLCVILCTSTHGGDLSPAERELPEAVKGIRARELGGHMKFLASDLMRGRDTASPEIAHRRRIPGEPALGGGGRARWRLRGLAARPTSRRFPLEVVTPQLEGTSVTLLLEQNGSKRVRALPARRRCLVHALGSRPGRDRGAGRLRRLRAGRRGKAHRRLRRTSTSRAGSSSFSPGERPGKTRDGRADERRPRVSRRGEALASARPGTERRVEHGALGMIVLRSTDAGRTAHRQRHADDGLIRLWSAVDDAWPSADRHSRPFIRGSDPRADPQIDRADARVEAQAARRVPRPVHVRGQEGVEGRPQRDRLFPGLGPRKSQGSRHL